MRRWYAVFTKPRQEGLANEHLGRQGFSTYFPRTLIRRRRGQWSAERIEPLFPRYLFVHIDILVESTLPIRSTRGVSGLVCFGGQLLAVPDPVLEFLMRSASPETGLHKLAGPQFSSGDRIVIRDGPLAGVEGIFAAESGEDRVLILLEILGRTNRVAVRRDSIALSGA